MARPLARTRSLRAEATRPVAEERVLRQVAYLSGLDALRGLPEEELRRLAMLSTLRVFNAGGLILSEHTSCTALFLVLHGMAGVKLRDKDGHEVLLGLLGRGDHFGEGPLFGDHFHRASVVAETNCQVLQIPLDELRSSLDDLPALAEALRAAYRRRLIESTLGRVPLFSQLSPLERSGVARLLRHERHPRSAVIVAQGEPSDALYLIEDGQALVEQSGQVIAHLDDGDFFGELSLLNRQPANATVRALTPLDVLILPGAAFHTLLEQQPALAAQLRAIGEARQHAGAAMQSDRARAERLDLAVGNGLLRGSHLLVRDAARCDPQCRLCERACTNRHGRARLRVGGLVFDDLDVLDTCRQCRFGAECIEACPEDAFRWSDGGALLITDACSGCGACVPACPYDAIALVPRPGSHPQTPLWRLWERLRAPRTPMIALEAAPPTKQADKCDFCEGFDDLACVTACPTGALRLVPVEELFPL